MDNLESIACGEMWETTCSYTSEVKRSRSLMGVGPVI